MSKHKLEKRPQRPPSEVPPPASVVQVTRKKPAASGSFQVTGVAPRCYDAADDSADDTDDISRVTDNETPSFSEDSHDEPPPQLPPPPPPPVRFKIVKMPTTINRGRWRCVDFFDDAAGRQTTVLPTSHFSGFSQNMIEVKSKGFSQGPLAISTKHVLDGSTTFQGRNFNSNITPKAAGEPSNFKGQRDDILSDIKVALTSIPTSQSASAPAPNNNIDRKIEEALDAVKTHLMVAVHKEVDFLKTRVSTLEGRVNELEIENSFLRVNYLLFKS